MNVLFDCGIKSLAWTVKFGLDSLVESGLDCLIYTIFDEELLTVSGRMGRASPTRRMGGTTTRCRTALSSSRGTPHRPVVVLSGGSFVGGSGTYVGRA